MSSSTAPVSRSRVSLTSLAGIVLVLLVVGQFASVESKFLRPARHYEDDFDGPYARPIRTGERAIVTVRGARDTYSGLPPRHMAIEAGPYGGGYPRGIYDRLDGGYGGPRGRPYGLGSDLVPVGSYGPRFDRYRMNNYHNGRPSMYDDAPARIAVTGVYPTYRSRF